MRSGWRLVGWKAAKWGALGLSIGSVAASVVMMATSQPRLAPTERADAPQTGQTRVEKPLIVERDGERVVWRLAAREASQQLDGRMRLTRPVLTLYAADDRAIPVASDMAWFQPLKRRIVFEGHVRVRDGERVLRCDRLVYAAMRGEIHVPGAFRAMEPGRRAQGRDLRIRRHAQTLDVRGGVVIEIDRADPRRLLPESSG
ncbi:MAG: hypothetical protein R8K47_06175 [Mariprofundaceae bacterium]